MNVFLLRGWDRLGERREEEGVSQRDNKSVLSPATMGLDGEGKEGFKPRPTYPPSLSQMDRAPRSD